MIYIGAIMTYSIVPCQENYETTRFYVCVYYEIVLSVILVHMYFCHKTRHLYVSHLYLMRYSHTRSVYLC